MPPRYTPKWRSNPSSGNCTKNSLAGYFVALFANGSYRTQRDALVAWHKRAMTQSPAGGDNWLQSRVKAHGKRAQDISLTFAKSKARSLRVSKLILT